MQMRKQLRKRVRTQRPGETVVKRPVWTNYVGNALAELQRSERESMSEKSMSEQVESIINQPRVNTYSDGSPREIELADDRDGKSRYIVDFKHTELL